MAPISEIILNAVARRPALENFSIESAPAVFETHDGKRTKGFASVEVTRPSIAVQFEPIEDLVVPKAGYGESNGKVTALDGAWQAPHVNDVGADGQGRRLFNTLEVVNGRALAEVAATRLYVAGVQWSGSDFIDGQRAVAHAMSSEAITHHDRRMALTLEGRIDPSQVENLGRACAFVGGLDVEVLRVEYISFDGGALETRHLRGYRRVGRGPHSPFTGLSDQDRMHAWSIVASSIPKLLHRGFPIDMILDQISAHNQVAQINVSAQLLISAAVSAAHHLSHAGEVGAGAASRRPEMEKMNKELNIGLSDADLERFEKLRVELLESGYFHKPGYETGRPQKDIKFIRDIAHAVVLRLCGYAGPVYNAERFMVSELKGV